MLPYSDLGLVTGRFCWMLVHDGPDAIIYTDIGGLIRFWNVSAERLFGYPAREALGRSLEFLVPETCRERYWETYNEALLDNRLHLNTTLVLIPAQRKDGACISIEFAMFRDLDCDGTMVGVAVIARNVTKRMRDQPTSQRLKVPQPINQEGMAVAAATRGPNETKVRRW